MTPENEAAARYFSAITAALSGLEVFMRDDRSPLYRHGIVAKVVAEYIARLDKSFTCWRNRLGFMDTFRISRAESGFPVFQKPFFIVCSICSLPPFGPSDVISSAPGT